MFPQLSVDSHLRTISPHPSTTVLLTSVKITSTTLSQLSVAVMVGTDGTDSQSTLTFAGSSDSTGAVLSVTVMVWV